MFTISLSHLQQNAFLKQHFLKINSKRIIIVKYYKLDYWTGWVLFLMNSRCSTDPALWDYENVVTASSDIDRSHKSQWYVPISF